jgi:hypothetical protein
MSFRNDTNISFSIELYYVLSGTEQRKNGEISLLAVGVTFHLLRRDLTLNDRQRPQSERRCTMNSHRHPFPSLVSHGAGE